ncbi:MAG: hypothetical protein M3461_18375 [Pseudomonadota bacterium]|nr:hypothetical protein [Pseudomonadota bacterium]
MRTFPFGERRPAGLVAVRAGSHIRDAFAVRRLESRKATTASGRARPVLDDEPLRSG